MDILKAEDVNQDQIKPSTFQFFKLSGNQLLHKKELTVHGGLFVAFEQKYTMDKGIQRFVRGLFTTNAFSFKRKT